MDPGAPGEIVLMAPHATRIEPKFANRTVPMVRLLSCELMAQIMSIKTNFIQINGIPGVAGATAAIPAEDTSPGAATVSRVTALLTTQAVLERLHRPWTVIMLTKVFFTEFLISFTDLTCRYSDHCIQRGTDLPSSYPGDVLTTRNPRETSSVAHSDRDRSLWRSLS